MALRTREVLKEHGIEVVMTREEDAMLGDADAQNRKAADMRERVKMINDLRPAIAVSIHQNSYTDSAVRGPQVFITPTLSRAGRRQRSCEGSFWRRIRSTPALSRPTTRTIC